MAAPTTSAPFSVANKSAIVTGAGSGINLSFAKLLLSNGCNVLIADIGLRPEAEAAFAAYSKKTLDKPRAIFLRTDVSNWKHLNNMFEVAYREFGDIDIVCPGAGIYEPHSSNFWHPPGSEKSRDDPEGGRYALIDINITHPIRTTQLAIQHFLSSDKGSKANASNPKRIVHVSSIAGELAGLSTPMYFASKHAISGFIYSLESLEPTLGIRVNGVAPGIIKTPLWTEHPEKSKYFNDKQDAWATPEEVAEAMLACVQDADLPGGTILEVGAKSRRIIPLHDNPGPANAPGLVVSDAHLGVQEVFDWLAGPEWSKTEL